MLVLALTAVAGVSAVVAWMADRRRCRQSNERGECGACGVLWVEAGSGAPYLIHGRLVCEDCAEKAKRRMLWELGALAGLSALLAGVVVTALATGSAMDVSFVIAGSLGVSFLGAVQLMKVANRSAERRIAAGEFPGFNSLGSGESSDTKEAVTDATERSAV